MLGRHLGIGSGNPLEGGPRRDALGAEAEVPAPAELRDRMAELTRAMAARYQTAQDGYQDRKDVRRSRTTKHS